MRAVACSEWQPFSSLEDVDQPEPGPGEVLLKVAGAGARAREAGIALGSLVTRRPPRDVRVSRHARCHIPPMAIPPSFDKEEQVLFPTINLLAGAQPSPSWERR